MNRTYFKVCELVGAPYSRWAVLDDGLIVRTQISRPEGDEVDRPSEVRWAEVKPVDVSIRTVNAQTYVYSTKQPGEQSRKVWNRVKRAAP